MTTKKKIFLLFMLVILPFLGTSQNTEIIPYLLLPNSYREPHGSDWTFLHEILNFSYKTTTETLNIHQRLSLEDLRKAVFPSYQEPNLVTHSIPLLLNQLVTINYKIPEGQILQVLYSLALHSSLPGVFTPEVQAINETASQYLTTTLEEAFQSLVSGEVNSVLTTAIDAFDFFHSSGFKELKGGLPEGSMFTVESFGPQIALHLATSSKETPGLLQPINYAVRMGRFNGEFLDLFDQWFRFDPDLPVTWSIDPYYPKID